MKLEELEKLLSEATPGKWSYDVAFGVRSDAPTSHNELFQIATETLHRDGDLIAALRNAAPALLAVVRAAKELQIFLNEDLGMDKPELTFLRHALQKLEEI